jgi:hypothetical protein
MADLKISQLPAATTPLAGTEVLPIVQSGTTVQVSVTNVIASRASLGANTFTAAQEWATGTAISSAATINLDTATGNRVHITGTTAITAVTLTRGPRTVIFDGILTLTHNATTNNLPGAANITTAAGDRAIYESDGTTVYCVTYIKASGAGVIASLPAATQAEMEAATSNTVAATPSNTQFHPGTAKVWLNCGTTGNILASYNVTSVSDTGTGHVTVTIATDFSSANYSIVTGYDGDAGAVLIFSVSIFAHSAGSFQAKAYNSGASLTDPVGWFFACYGDQA